MPRKELPRVSGSVARSGNGELTPSTSMRVLRARVDPEKATLTRKRKSEVEDVSDAAAGIRAPKKPRTAPAGIRPKRNGPRRLLANGFASDAEASDTERKKKPSMRTTAPSSLRGPPIKPGIREKPRGAGKIAKKTDAQRRPVQKKNPQPEPTSSSDSSTSLAAKLRNKFASSAPPPKSDNDDDSDDSESWEAVEEAKLPSDDENDDNQSGPSTSRAVEITVDLSGTGKPKNKQVDMQKRLLFQLKKRQKEIQTDIHKVHLLCGLARGFYLNDVVCRNPHVLSLALSCWDKPTLDRVFDQSHVLQLDARKLRALVASVRRSFPVKEADGVFSVNVLKSLTRKSCSSNFNLALVMVLMLRSLGLDVRLIYSMQPVPVKEVTIPKSVLLKGRGKPSPYFAKGKGGKAASTKLKKAKPKRKRKESTDDDSSDSSSEEGRGPESQFGKKSGDSLPKVVISSDDDLYSDSKVKLKRGKSILKSAASAGDSGQRRPKRSITTPSPKNVPFAEEAVRSSALGIDYWLDVYCDVEKAFVPVKCTNGEVGSLDVCELSASQPLQYVVAFGDVRSAKDVTAKFAKAWLTANRKLQVDPKWWTETLKLFAPRDIIRNAEEDFQIREVLMQRPLPASVQEFKGHPLYVLERHLLKYEALYPPNPLPVGNVKGENYYLRELVHLLHTKENWLKEARVIKPSEQPYKEVKRMKRAVPKRKGRGNSDSLNAVANRLPPKDEMSGLYGRWQTEDFIPPVAQNGIVPRNEYGNVDMFQPSMLPVGCVHIPIKNIHKVAKQLGIDCAAAMTGWDFSSGWCHPMRDGWIVCAEFEETLLDAWNSQQFEIEKEEKDAQKKKTWDNWKRMIRSALLRARLNLKWGTAEPPVKKKAAQAATVID
ncbi:DNA repair protein complementing XP-C cells-like protein [Hypsibius exemplaris]|uniref:DNA repair protein complementing XP-C cells-like protein n=1 Tax=Hypsibius exemplaris TaxID=2072580 RepID=A0A1W0X796_HYPEX|nr:DNA repair protein complementing XP-C cells-like protein [Hypsibius exemplaris]